MPIGLKVIFVCLFATCIFARSIQGFMKLQMKSLKHICMIMEIYVHSCGMLPLAQSTTM